MVIKLLISLTKLLFSSAQNNTATKKVLSFQVLQGSYPVSQVREPMSIIQFLAERVDLVNLLSIQHPESDNSK